MGEVLTCPCKGLNCGCTDGVSHSLECHAQHAAAIAGGVFMKAAKPETERAELLLKIEAAHADALAKYGQDNVLTKDLCDVLNFIAALPYADSKDAGEPVGRMRSALDAIYNESDECRAAVIKHYGVNHHFDTRPQAADAQPLKAYADAVAWVERRLDDFLAEHSTFDPETGATEFGRGSRGRAMEEYAGELQEIIDGLRAHGITGKDNAS